MLSRALVESLSKTFIPINCNRNAITDFPLSLTDHTFTSVRMMYLITRLTKVLFLVSIRQSKGLDDVIITIVRSHHRGKYGEEQLE